jgi:hypothetical protein
MSASKVLRGAIAVAAALLLPAAAHAQLFRSYLARGGNDANPCTLPDPCRLLPAALAAVADGGEVWMLDSANYNATTVNVAKSVTILAVPGALGSVVAASGPAISIATAGVKVALRNLVIVPLPGSRTRPFGTMAPVAFNFRMAREARSSVPRSWETPSSASTRSAAWPVPGRPPISRIPP